MARSRVLTQKITTITNDHENREFRDFIDAPGHGIGETPPLDKIPPLISSIPTSFSRSHKGIGRFFIVNDLEQAGRVTPASENGIVYRVEAGS
jgi:hypothetical protein